MRFRLNGVAVEVESPPMARLLDVIRMECGLTGTKEGCGEGECGACTVVVNGEPVCSCLIPVAQVAACEVLTVEGLGGEHPLQTAFIEEGAAQCGICTPGMLLMAATIPAGATLEEVRTGLAGNLCRCTGYEAIYRAVLKVTNDGGAKAAGGRTANPP